MSAAPVFVGRPQTWHCALSAANTERIFSSGTLVTLLAGNTSAVAPLTGIGSRVDTLRAIASGTTTAGVIRMWLNDGTNTRMFKEIMVQAITPSASVEVWFQDLTFAEGLIIPNLWSLRMSTHNAETFNVIARGGDL